MKLFFKLLKIEFWSIRGTSQDVVPVFCFLICLFSLLHFLGSIQPEAISTVSWVFLGILVVQGSQSLFKDDFESGNLELIYSASPYLGITLVARVLGYSLSILIVTLLGGYMFGLLGVLPYMFLAAVLCAMPGLAVVASLVSVLMLRESTLDIRSLLSLPLILPFIILGITATNSPERACFALKTLVGLSLITVPPGLLGLKVIVVDKIKQP